MLRVEAINSIHYEVTNQLTQEQVTFANASATEQGHLSHLNQVEAFVKNFISHLIYLYL